MRIVLFLYSELQINAGRKLSQKCGESDINV